MPHYGRPTIGLGSHSCAGLDPAELGGCVDRGPAPEPGRRGRGPTPAEGPRNSCKEIDRPRARAGRAYGSSATTPGRQVARCARCGSPEPAPGRARVRPGRRRGAPASRQPRGGSPRRAVRGRARRESGRETGRGVRRSCRRSRPSGPRGPLRRGSVRPTPRSSPARSGRRPPVVAGQRFLSPSQGGPVYPTARCPRSGRSDRGLATRLVSCGPSSHPPDLTELEREDPRRVRRG